MAQHSGTQEQAPSSLVDRAALRDRFPVGTPVCIVKRILRRATPIEIEVVGVIEEWEELPTGSWYAHGKNDRLWLQRVMLRKVDGERTLLVVDDQTSIAKLEANGTTSTDDAK